MLIRFLDADLFERIEIQTKEEPSTTNQTEYFYQRSAVTDDPLLGEKDD
jgi:hypothetical protein